MPSLDRWRFILLFCLLCCTAPASAESIKIDPSEAKVNLIPFSEYSVHPDANLEIPPVENWITVDNDDLKLGFSSQTHWLRVVLENPNPMPTSLYLEVANPLLDQLNVYFVEEGRVSSSQRLGDQQNFHLRPVLQETFITPISILPDKTTEVYIAFKSDGLLNLDLNLWQKEAFQQAENKRRLINGLFLGIALAAVIGCFLLGAFRRDWLPIFDAGILVSLALITSTLNGYGFHYLWPNLPGLQQHAIYLFSCTGIFFSALMAMNNLKRLNDENKFMFIKAFKSVGGAALVCIPLTLFLSYQVGLYLVVGAVIIICLAHISTGIWIWKHGVHDNQEVNIGLLTLLLTLFVISINNFTALPLPFNNAQLLQFSLVVIALSIALSLIKTEAKIDAPVSHSADEDELQEQLANQNFELEVALRELQERNQELEKLNTLDALSGIHNRRHFDKRILAELRRSRRELTPLALVMFDIDHFKAVNDNYGHLTGDEVIRSVAHVAQEQLNRSADEIFRYGGEEYALVLPNTEKDGAELIAEKVRAAVEGLTIQGPNEKVKCTISLGVAVSDARQAMSPEQIIEQADSALYKAKQGGRNQVVTYQVEDEQYGSA